MPQNSNYNSKQSSDMGTKRAVKNPETLSKSDSNTELKTPAPQNTGRRKRTAKKKGRGKYIARFFLTLLVVILLFVYVLFSALSTVATGPSKTVRDLLVLSAMQASATKWVPGLFLPEETVAAIVADSKKIETDTVSIDDYIKTDDEYSKETDIWEKAIDGMIFETISGSTYKAYILLVKDPSRVFVGTSSDYKSNAYGMNIFNLAKKYNAVAAINGGEFSDPGGVGTGNNPIGITYSKGELMWNDGYNNRTFIGIDKNNRLVVTEGMNKKRSEELEIRDGVCFQTGNVLITNENNEVVFHYADGNTGTAQRSAIGQRADGTIILLVTDGRSASSLGATHNDVIDIMVSYGAVCAGMLDGGSSAMMYYENYYEKYDYNTDNLDKYQKQGLVNKYKAFTKPRRIPTCFIVGGEG